MLTKARTLPAVHAARFCLLCLGSLIAASAVTESTSGQKIQSEEHNDAPIARLTAAVNAALGLRAATIVTLAIDPDSTDEPIVAVVPIEGVPFILDLEPYSVRGENYQVLAQIADGSSLVRVEPGPVRTLRGSLVGVPGSVVAGSLLQDGLHARIVFPDGGEYWIEPIGSRVAGASPNDYVVYHGDDVLKSGGSCGTDATLVAPVGKGVGVGQGGVAGGGESICVAEFAADADYEYFQAYGSVSAVEARINSIINTVNVQYERDVGITHIITTIIVRTAEPDPYSEMYVGPLLVEFRAHWLANHAGIHRDLAQLFTGKDLIHSAIGYAWIGAVCTEYGFSVVRSDWSNNFDCVTAWHAHELGHNWGANHCACADPSYTMNPWGTCANEFHPEYTIPEIIAFRDSRTCLDRCDDGAGGAPPPAPSALSATAMSSSEIDLTWTDNADDESGFEIERSLNGNNQWASIAAVDPNVTSYPDTGLAAATTYFYRLLAYNNNGDSPYSNIDSATTDDDGTASIEAELTGLSITNGTWLSGGLVDLELSDDSYVVIDAAQQGNKYKAESIVTATSPLTSVSQLDLTIEVGVDANNVKITVYLFNFNNNKWSRIDSYAQPQGDTERAYLDLANPNRYVNSTSGEIRVKILTQATANQTPGGYIARIDHVQVDLAP